MQQDYIIVGSGFFGAICARELTDRGYKYECSEEEIDEGGGEEAQIEEPLILTKG